MYQEDVAVTFRTESNYFDVHPSFPDNVTLDGYDSISMCKYIMEVRCSEFYADIEIDVFHTARQHVSAIASCVMAGLRLVPGHELVFENIAGQLKNSLKIDINRKVSPEIGSLVKTNYEKDGIPRYFVRINEGFGFYQIAPHLEAVMLDNSLEIEFRMELEHKGKKYYAFKRFDPDMWHEYGDKCLVSMKQFIIEDLFNKFPECGNDWAYLESTWFDEDFKKYEADNYVSPAFNKQHLKPIVGNNYSAPPNVAGLPGVTAMVKHPESHGQVQLWHAIVDLNDNWGWSRERVADWLETLDVDISFRSIDDKQD